MKSLILITILLSTLYSVQAQYGYITLRKHNKPKKTFYVGSYISGEHIFGYHITGQIANIRKDSVFLGNYYIKRVENDKGFVFFDTLRDGITPYAITDFKVVYVNRKSTFFALSAGTMIASGIWFSIMSIVNGTRFGQSPGQIIKEVAIRGGGFIGGGLLFAKLGNDARKIGKKYSLHTVVY